LVREYDGGALWRFADRDHILSPVPAHGQSVSGHGGSCAGECAHFLDSPDHRDAQSALVVHCCDLDTLATDAKMGGESHLALYVYGYEGKASATKQAMIKQRRAQQTTPERFRFAPKDSRAGPRCKEGAENDNPQSNT
jgi:hypothetical protein